MKTASPGGPDAPRGLVTRGPRGSGITFVRLAEVPLDTLVAHMSDPRMAEHMPLLTAPWTRDTAAAFVRTKEALWERDGVGHEAIFHDGRYVGWGGFQKEGHDWDFGLVLTPDAFGLGGRITREALARARSDPRIPSVTFLLPPSRTRLKALARLGATFVSEVEHEGAVFRKYRVETGGLPTSSGWPLLEGG